MGVPGTRGGKRGLLALLAAGLLIVALHVPAAAAENWFVAFEGLELPPVRRSDVTQLLEVGTVDTDGFSELVFSFGGEFKESVPTSGLIGAILIPDVEQFVYLLRSEAQFVFPLEVKFNAAGMTQHVFISPQQTAKVAFPRYRVFLYNETQSSAKISLYVYRTRR